MVGVDGMHEVPWADRTDHTHVIYWKSYTTGASVGIGVACDIDEGKRT